VSSTAHNTRWAVQPTIHGEHYSPQYTVSTTAHNTRWAVQTTTHGEHYSPQYTVSSTDHNTRWALQPTTLLTVSRYIKHISFHTRSHQQPFTRKSCLVKNK
jgi:hypothetical protein